MSWYLLTREPDVEAVVCHCISHPDVHTIRRCAGRRRSRGRSRESTPTAADARSSRSPTTAEVALEPLTGRYFTERSDRLFNFRITLRAVASYAGVRAADPLGAGDDPGPGHDRRRRPHGLAQVHRALPGARAHRRGRPSCRWRAWATSSTSTTSPTRCRPTLEWIERALAGSAGTGRGRGLIDRRRLEFRVVLYVLGGIQLLNGIWITISPTSFYDDFPLGRGWVEALPSYNEHLMSDVGGLFMATGVLLIVAGFFARAQRSSLLALVVVPPVRDPAHGLSPPQPGAVRHRRRDRQRDRPRRDGGAAGVPAGPAAPREGAATRSLHLLLELARPRSGRAASSRRRARCPGRCRAAGGA